MNYWVVIDRKKIGPLTLEETLRMPLTADSYVWHRGLPTWVHAGEVPELAPMFAPVQEKMAQEGAEAAVEVEQEEADAENAVASTDADNSEAIAQAVEEEEDELAYGPKEEEEADAARSQFPIPPPPPYRAPAPLRPLPPADDSRMQRPPSYLGWNVAAIICCCLITGIIGVIFSSRVNPLYDRGEFEEARKASERAELCLIISIVAALVALPFQFILMFAQ